MTATRKTTIMSSKAEKGHKKKSKTGNSVDQMCRQLTLLAKPFLTTVKRIFELSSSETKSK